LLYCNGQSDFFSLTFPPDQLVFLSSEEVVDLWTELNRDPDDQFFDQFEADGKIRSVLQHQSRIPVAYNEAGGAYLFLDYIPGPNGKEKQLVFNINEVDSVVIEDSFYNLIQNYVQLLERGKIVIKKQPPEYGQGYWFVSAENELINWTVYKRLREA
jgi:cell wall assembly regulator SMI1